MQMVTTDISMKQTIAKYQEVFTESCISIGGVPKKSKSDKNDASEKDAATKNSKEAKGV